MFSRYPGVATEAARLFKALSDENRLKILALLLSHRNRKLSVTEIVRHLGLSQPLVSHHLKELRYAGLLTHERKGAFVYYRLASPGISGLLEMSFSLLDAMKKGGNPVRPNGSILYKASIPVDEKEQKTG